MKDTKYKILAYFDNQSYRKLFNEVNSDCRVTIDVTPTPIQKRLSPIEF